MKDPRFLVHGKDITDTTEEGIHLQKGENIGNSNRKPLKVGKHALTCVCTQYCCLLNEYLASPLRVNPGSALAISRSPSASSLVHLAPRKEEDFQATESEQSYDHSSLMFEASGSSDSDEAESITSAWSATSISSASSLASDDVTSVADEIVEVFLTDESLQNLFSKILSKENHGEVLKNNVALLKWMGRRLVAVGKTPMERLVAKVFLRRRYDRYILHKIVQLMSPSSREGKQKEAEAFRKEKAARQSRLESYFRELTNIDDDDSDDSNDSNIEKNEQLKISWNVQVVKDFLRESDLFLRFKEEFADSVSPFENKAMWSKVLWNSGERVRFEPPVALTRFSNVDKLKLAIEQKLGMPVLWWPLKQPRKRVLSGKVRIVWICVSQILDSRSK